MTGRDEPTPAGESRGRARTGRGRRRPRRGGKATPEAGGPPATSDPDRGSAVPEPGKRTANGSGAKRVTSGGKRRDAAAAGSRKRDAAKRRDAATPVRLRRVEEVSAGGLVVHDRDGQLVGALIAKHDRRGRLVWSLPKGHVEDGETLEQTAAREVAEETGVTGEVVAPLGSVDYWFVFGGRKIHKTVHHFLLRRVAGELSDHDVEVAEVAWVPLTEIPGQLAYPDERRLMGQVRDLLAKSA